MKWKHEHRKRILAERGCIVAAVGACLGREAIRDEAEPDRCIFARAWLSTYRGDRSAACRDNYLETNPMARKSTTRKKPASRKKAPARKKAARRKTAGSSAAVRYKATPASMSDKDQLISVIQAGTGSTKKAAQATLKAILGTITASLKRNKKVQLVGFGAFDVVNRRARMGRNPATGEKIRIKASKRVRFRAGTELKGSI